MAYKASRDRPNIVVDGAANDATVLAVSHWPGTVQPPGLRASMTIAAYADPQRSPMADELVGLAYDEQCGILYGHTLPMLVAMATASERFRDLWGTAPPAWDPTAPR